MLNPSVAKLIMASLFLCLTSIGCTKEYIDMSVVKPKVSEFVNHDFGLTGVTVACPERGAVKSGDSFECIGTTPKGGKIRVQVTQKRASGEFDLKVVRLEGVIDLDDASNIVQEGIKKRLGISMSVGCGGMEGGRFAEAKPGDTRLCTAKVEGGEQKLVVITVEDNLGHISWKFEKRSP